MFTPTKICVLLLAALLGSVPVSQADPPSGQINLAFTSATAEVFDFSGGYPITQDIIGAGGQNIPLSFGISLSQDPRGFIRGADATFMSVGNDFVAAQYNVTGKVSGGGRNQTRVSLTVRLSGQDIIAGRDTVFQITIAYNLVVNANGTLSGTARGSAHFSKSGSGRINTSVSTPLPTGMDGSWGLQLNILPLNRLGGTASIVLANGRVLSGNVAGSYSPTTGASQVTVTGTGDSRGVSAHVNFTSTVVNKLTGTVLGQTVLQ